MALDQDTVDQIIEALMQTEEMQFIRQKLMAEADAERAPGEDFEPAEPIDVDGERRQVDKVVSYAKRYGLSFDEAAAKVHYRRPRRPAASQPKPSAKKVTVAQAFSIAAEVGCTPFEAAAAFGR